MIPLPAPAMPPAIGPAPTPAERYAAERLMRAIADALAAHDWLTSPAPAGWATLENSR